MSSDTETGYPKKKKKKSILFADCNGFPKSSLNKTHPIK